MTEAYPIDPNREYDKEDILAQKALSDMQDIVDRIMRASKRSIDKMTHAEKIELARTIDPYLKFELSVSEGVYTGLPLEISGRGAFLALDRDGEFENIQATDPTDLITGTVGRIEATAVPTRAMVLATDPRDGEVKYHEESMSAILLLENAVFYAEPNADGLFQVEHDFSGFQIVIPLVYRMKYRVANIGRIC